MVKNGRRCDQHIASRFTVKGQGDAVAGPRLDSRAAAGHATQLHKIVQRIPVKSAVIKGDAELRGSACARACRPSL